MISIVIPTLNEQGPIFNTLTELQCLRRVGHELIIVDGGSTDTTVEITRPLADQVLVAKRGRAKQMNTGATASHGDILVFLHADTILPKGADSLIMRAVHTGALWGRFDVEIDGPGLLLRLVAIAMNVRSQITGIATGDQAIWVKKDFFEAIGAFPELSIMEDIAMSTKMNALVHPACLRPRVRTSGRRWLEHGVAKTILSMCSLRLAYFLGVPPRILSNRYPPTREQIK